jgi:hypothetical protein
LSKRLEREQGLPRARAAALAADIGAADDDIRAAAEQWLDTGEMPAEPVIEGYSPRALAEFLPPSDSLTALIALRDDPEGTLTMLQHPGDLEFLAEGLTGQEPDSAEDAEVAREGHPANDLLDESSTDPEPSGEVSFAWPPPEMRSMVEALEDVVPAAQEARIRVKDWEPYAPPPALAGEQPDLYTELGDKVVVMAKVKREPDVMMAELQQLRSLKECADREGAEKVHIVYFVPRGQVGSVQKAVEDDIEPLRDAVHICPYEAEAARMSTSGWKNLFESYLEQEGPTSAS